MSSHNPHTLMHKYRSALFSVFKADVSVCLVKPSAFSTEFFLEMIDSSYNCPLVLKKSSNKRLNTLDLGTFPLTIARELNYVVILYSSVINYVGTNRGNRICFL